MRCDYWGSDARRSFDILIDSQRLASQSLTGARRGEYIVEVYPIPAAMLKGKETVRVRFEPHDGSVAGGVMDVQLVLDPHRP